MINYRIQNVILRGRPCLPLSRAKLSSQFSLTLLIHHLCHSILSRGVPDRSGDMDSDSEPSELQELDDHEGFDDFTVASSWERLISDIEAACRKWQTAGPKGLLAAGAVVAEGHGNLHQVMSEFTHGIKGYRLEFFFEIDGSGGMDDWKVDKHHLQLWFGVRDFLVIAPISMSGVILDAPEATVLLSAVAIALSNCGSIWPAFVPVHDPTRKSYKGIQGMRGPYSRSFEADRIGSQVPVKLMHLEGLYDLFISKLAFSLPDSTLQDNVKVRFTMRLTYRTPMPGFEYVQSEDAATPTAEPVANYESDIAQKAQWDEECPWAEWYSVDDPIKGFELITIWASRLVEGPLDMAEFENISTFEADKWLLAPIIAKGLEDAKRDEQVSFASRMRALVTAFSLAKEAKFMEDFAAADNPTMERITSSTTIPPPGVLDRVLKELFHEAPGVFGFGDSTSQHRHARTIKGAPTDSLFAQFCLQALWFGTCNIRAIASLWIEFVREVRWCWEELQPLPRISSDQPPDLDTCLLHQKLQLLAACIKRKAAEQRLHVNIKTGAGQSDHESPGTTEGGEVELEHNSDPENNFTGFPGQYADSAATEVENAATPVSHIVGSSVTSEPVNIKYSVQKHSTWEHEQQRQGSTGPEGNMMLLKSCQRLHAPITQGAPIMTEDMLLEREQAIVALSNSPSGKIAQTRLQTDILSSDMAAFKAANPGAVLEDFVRWHSPNDWIENDQANDSVETSGPGVEDNDQEKSSGRWWPPSGKLSERMSQPGNTWDQIWRTVDSVPVSEQKPLFDHTREGEKVIHYLETLKPHQLLAQMICTAFGAVADILHKTETGELRSLLVELDQLYLTIASVLKPLRNLNISDMELAANLEEWHTDIMDLCAVFEGAEKHVIMAASLYQKLPTAPRLLTALFDNYIKLGRLRQSTPVVKLCQVVSMSERDTIATLFPPLSSSETWKKSLRMGNFLNGHEPLVREIVFSHFEHYFQGKRERYRTEHASTFEQILSHRMYIHGTSNDFQVAYSVVSDD